MILVPRWGLGRILFDSYSLRVNRASVGVLAWAWLFWRSKSSTICLCMDASRVREARWRNGLLCGLLTEWWKIREQKNWAYVLRGGRGKWPDATGRVRAGRSIRVAFVSCCCVLSAGNRAQPVAPLDFEALPFANYGALLTYAVGLVRSRTRGESGLLGGIAFEHTVINLSAQDLQHLLLHETVWVVCR